MGVAVKIEVGEIRNRFGRALRGHLARAYEASQALSDFYVREVRRMKLVLISKETSLDSGAKRGLQEEFQEG